MLCNEKGEKLVLVTPFASLINCQNLSIELCKIFNNIMD